MKYAIRYISAGILVVSLGCANSSASPSGADVTEPSFADADTDLFGADFDGTFDMEDAELIDIIEIDGYFDSQPIGDWQIAIDSFVADAATTDTPIIIVATPPRLLPPLTSTLKATKGGEDITTKCKWSASPATVCEINSTGIARRLDSGSCTLTCAIGEALSPPIVIDDKPQPVLYLMGGQGWQYSKVSRLRIADKEWDANVTALPYGVEDAAVGGNGKKPLCCWRVPMGNLRREHAVSKGYRSVHGSDV